MPSGPMATRPQQISEGLRWQLRQSINSEVSLESDCEDAALPAVEVEA